MTGAARRLALIAQRGEAELYTDGPAMVAALDRKGVEASIFPWGPPRRWADFDGVVVRGASDYLDNQDEFAAWADGVATQTRLANPPDVLRWNSDKRYLRDLEAGGVPLVPTMWVEPGSDFDPAEVPWDEFVVKPIVSAGARDTARYDGSRWPAAVDHVGRLASSGAGAMVQPYLPVVETDGEVGVFVFGGEVSHAVSKLGVLRPGAAPVDDFTLAIEQEAATAQVTPGISDFADRVLAAVPGGAARLLYARVDFVPDGAGDHLLLELELIEPFFFFDTYEAAADRFADAVLEWLAPRA